MPQTLLLADDSATIQRVIELTFADEDIKVISVSDGDQAIARIEASPPDIVLADVGMPGKNGYEVAEYVKRSPTLSHIPVMLLTGAFEPVDQVKAAAVGCDGVLAKPFEPQLVISRVRELLGRSAAEVSELPPPVAPAASILEFAPPPPPAAAPAVAEPTPEARVEDYFDRLDAAFANLNTAPSAAAPAAAAPAPPPPPPAFDELDWLNPKKDDAYAADLQDFAIADELATEPAVAAEVEPEPEVAPEPEFAREPYAPIPVATFESIEVAEVPEAPEPPVFEEAPAPMSVAHVAPVAAPEPPEPVVEPPEPLELVEPLEPVEPLKLANRGPRVLPSIAEAFGVILAAEQNALGVRPEWPAPPPAPAAAPAEPVEVVITDDLVDRVARRVLEQLSDRVVRDTVASIASEAAERLVREEIERIKSAIK